MADRAHPNERMSDVEALMWTLEKDPFLSAAFANLTIFDRPLDVDRLRRRLVQATQAVPRLRQRVAAGLGRLAPPAWEDDPDFDIDRHVRRLALPAPGSDEQLLDLAAVLAADPLDRTRPLWEFHVIEGLPGGRAAMVQKIHHTITDGEGGVRMSIEFIDLERDAPEPAGPEEPAVGGRGPRSSRSLASTALDTFAHNVRRQAAMARRSVESTVEVVRDPARLLKLPAEASATVGSVLRQVLITDDRHSPLWRERSLRRQFRTFEVPLEDARSTAKALGGSINDFFVAGAAGAAGAYHRQLGADVDELRISMPVSTRTDRSAGGNAFSLTRALVPVGPDPITRFTEIHDRLAVAKQERAVGLTAGLAGLVNVLPTSVLVRTARQQVETVDFTTSNVKAAPFDLYIAGAKMEGNYPMGPIAGTAFNLTTMSYRGMLDMGLHIDTAAVAEPGRLLHCMQESFAELVEATR